MTGKGLKEVKGKRAGEDRDKRKIRDCSDWFPEDSSSAMIAKLVMQWLLKLEMKSNHKIFCVWIMTSQC